MEERQRKQTLLEKTAQALDLPADAVAGLPRLSLVGDRELLVENHRGILAYGTQEIHIGGGRLVIRVRGDGLQLRAMNETELLITGQIFGVELM